MDKIKIRKSTCNRLINSKNYYNKQKDYYKEYHKDYYENNKTKLSKNINDEKKKLYNRNYVRQKYNYKNIKVLDERFDTNLNIDSFDNFDDFVKDLNI